MSSLLDKPSHFLDKNPPYLDVYSPHDELDYNCGECNFNTNNEYNFNEHLKICNTNNIDKTKINMYCQTCDVKCSKLSDWKRHLNSKRHISKNNNLVNLDEQCEKYYCSSCNYRTNRSNDWNYHIKCKKHIKNINKNEGDKDYVCSNCSKQYNTYNGLWMHKKKCALNNTVYNNNDYDNERDDESENIVLNVEDNVVLNESQPKTQKTESEIQVLTQLVIEVVKNNNEFQKQILDLIKNTNNNTISNNNNNINSNNNQTFNLQFFLNETCKEAINMSDFINSFDLKMTDLERLADDGYVKTMSNLIINKVRELEVEKRPIHCSDERRETIYIKENDVWIKDDENKSNLRTAINKIGCKNIGLLKDWQKAHPNHEKYNSPYNDTFIKLMKEVVGGRDTRGNENKVIKSIVKEVVIDKQQYLK